VQCKLPLHLQNAAADSQALPQPLPRRENSSIRVLSDVQVCLWQAAILSSIAGGQASLLTQQLHLLCLCWEQPSGLMPPSDTAGGASNSAERRVQLQVVAGGQQGDSVPRRNY
jgi:hypothetical protein